MTLYNLVIMSWNQVFENIFCNSESYNHIFERGRIYRDLSNNVEEWVNQVIITPNKYVFSQILEVDLSSNLLPIRFNQNRELNRRDLIVTAFIDNDEQFTSTSLIVGYTYTFDYHSPKKHFLIGDTPTINKKICMCTDIIANQTYVFKTNNIKVFHFTFHSPNMRSKNIKYRGAFHTNIDYLSLYKVTPFRPFTLDPRASSGSPRFILWEEFEPGMNNIFTTDSPVTDVNEIQTFIINSSPELSFQNDHGVNIHIINDIVRPIYNRIVTFILNPLLNDLGGDITVPAAVTYIPDTDEDSVIDCSMMKIIRTNPTERNNVLQTGRTILMGGNGHIKHNRTRKLLRQWW